MFVVTRFDREARALAARGVTSFLPTSVTASFEKLIVDAEMLQIIAEYLRPIDVNDDELAVDAIAEVGPGGHHFGTAHTLERYEHAFYAPLLSTRQNFENW